MSGLGAADSALLAGIAAGNAAKARAVWLESRDVAFQIARQAIEAGADAEAVVGPLRGICTDEQLADLAFAAAVHNL